MELRLQVYVFLSSSHGKEFRRRVEEETHSWAVLGLQAKRNRAGMRDSREKKKTLNKHVLREHRSGFVGDSMFPQGTGWMSLDLEWMTEITWILSSTCCLVFWKFTHHLPLSTFPPILTKKSLFLIHGSPYTKEVTKLVFKKDLIWEEQSKICSAINSRSALVINLLFISFNYKSFFLVSLQPWSGEYLDLKTKGIYKCVCCGSELFRYELMSKVFCKEKKQVPYWRPFPCSFSLTQLSQQVWFSLRMAVISFSSRNVIQ